MSPATPQSSVKRQNQADNLDAARGGIIRGISEKAMLDAGITMDLIKQEFSLYMESVGSQYIDKIKPGLELSVVDFEKYCQESGQKNIVPPSS